MRHMRAVHVSMRAWLICIPIRMQYRYAFDSSLTLRCLTHGAGSRDGDEEQVSKSETLDYSTSYHVQLHKCQRDALTELTRWHLKTHNLHVHTASTLATATLLYSESLIWLCYYTGSVDASN